MRWEVPVDPTADQARQWLQDELAQPIYSDTRSLLQRAIDALMRWVADLQDTQGTGGVSLPPIVITVLVIALVVAGAFLLTKVRRERRVPPPKGSVLGGTDESADQLRARGAEALTQQRYGDAVLAYTRAIARDADRRTLLSHAEAMTAHEIGAELTVSFPAQAAPIASAMDVFDAVAYGGRTATRDEAEGVRETDRLLQAARPVRTSGGAGGPSDPGGPSARGGDGAPGGGGDPGHTASAQLTGAGSVWSTGGRR